MAKPNTPAPEVAAEPVIPEVPQVEQQQPQEPEEPVYKRIGNHPTDFIAYLDKQVMIDNGQQQPYFDVLEAIASYCIFTKHGERVLFWQLKAAE